MRISPKNKRLSKAVKSELPNEAVEEQTKKIPNLVFLGLGLASLIGQAAVERYLKKRFLGPVLGIWGPVFLILGLYNKMVKLEHELVPSERIGSLH